MTVPANGTQASINIVRAGPRDGPPVVLLHALSLDLTYWDGQFAQLSQTHDVLAFDWPGHGRSSPLNEGISFASLSKVVATVIRETGVGPAHIVGLSMGSMVAQNFALGYRELVRSLCLIGSACTFPEPVRQGMRNRAAILRENGTPAVLQESLERWYTPEFRERRPDFVDRASKTILAGNPEVQAATWEMIAGLDTQHQLADLTCPTLVLGGAQDPSTTPAAAQFIAQQISGAEVQVIAGASHMVTSEMPEEVNACLHKFFVEK